MVDHAALVPSFRDFSHYRVEASTEPPAELPKPTVLEVEHILKESPAGKLGEAISFEGWPWLERMAFLEEAIPGIKVHSLGGLAPFQADGVWGPYEWYYRERGGYSTLSLAPIATFPGAQESLYRAEGEVPEFAGASGWLTRFLKHWEALKRAPFLYEFPAREVDLVRRGDTLEAVVTGESTVQAGWGYNPTDAWLDAGSYHPYLDEMLGWTKELQEERRELMEISREPVNRDERVYPLEDPDFSVDWEALRIPEELQRFVGAEPSSNSSEPKEQ